MERKISQHKWDWRCDCGRSTVHPGAWRGRRGYSGGGERLKIPDNLTNPGGMSSCLLTSGVTHVCLCVHARLWCAHLLFSVYLQAMPPFFTYLILSTVYLFWRAGGGVLTWQAALLETERDWLKPVQVCKRSLPWAIDLWPPAGRKHTPGVTGSSCWWCAQAAVCVSEGLMPITRLYCIKVFKFLSSNLIFHPEAESWCRPYE